MGFKVTAISSIILGWGLLIAGCSDDSGAGENRGERLIPAVEAVQTKYGALPLTERLSGLVKARNQVEIYPEITATIVEVHANNGDFVKKGQILVRLRDREFAERLNQARAAHRITEAQAKQAEAELTKTRAELNRIQTLSEKKLASDTELETIQTRAISAEADFELAQARVAQALATINEREDALSRTLIRSPISGSVGNRNAEVGMLVNSNSRLFTLGQIDNVHIEVILTDQMLNYIETGQRSEIIVDNAQYGSLTAPLSRISPFLNPITHSTEAEIDLANPDGVLKPGMFVTVDIYYGESESATLVPLSALYENPLSGITGVYISNDSLNQEPVTVIKGDQDIRLTGPVAFDFVPVEVIARGRMHAGVNGIEPGNWVITIGQDLLGGEPGEARVRKVDWNWVEHLQNLQRQDLMLEIINKRQENVIDTTT
jgi:RND family efflux transporter MFP subunit